VTQGANGAEFVTDDGLVLPVSAKAASGSGLSIRPEHIHLPARPSDAIRIPASVTNVEFFGAELIVSCGLDSGRVLPIPIRSDDDRVPQVGARVDLGVSPDRCRVVADD
jgi:hypothetical protein